MPYFPQGLVEVVRHRDQNKDPDSVIGTRPSRARPYTQRFTNYPTTILNFNNSGKQLHPTQKPVELCEYLIKTYTKEGEVVLDNCMGSGTTAVACIRTGRNYIGFELDEQYHAIAMERIAAEVDQLRDDDEIPLF